MGVHKITGIRSVGIVLSAIALAAGLAGGAGAETLYERGAYLVNTIAACGNCHSPHDPGAAKAGGEFTGKLVIEMEPFTAYAPNITPDRETGIGGWSDADIIRAIRDGRRPDGSLIGPPMPFEYYRQMSDRDVNAIAAYMRKVKPVRHIVQKSVYRIPLPPAYGPPVTSVPEPDRADKLAYGAYLAGPVGHCLACHSPLGPKGPDLEHNLGAGGNVLEGPWGVAVSANLTSHEDGLKNWSDDDIKRAITQGKKPDGTPLTGPMAVPYYKDLTPQDLDALVAFLRTLPPKASP